MHRGKSHFYSITSSAIARTPGGRATPSVLAVLRLITNSSNRLVGRFLALQYATDVDAGLAKHIAKVDAIAHQDIADDGLAVIEDRRHRGVLLSSSPPAPRSQRFRRSTRS